METRIQPFDHSAEVAAAHERLLARCEERRAAKVQTFDHNDPDLLRACGNGGEITRFLAMEQFTEADKRLLLGLLRDKDLVDATADLLTDALTHALPVRANYPEHVWRESVLCPRVGDEMLYPVRGAVKAWFGTDIPQTPQALWTMLKERIEPVPSGSVPLIPDIRCTLAAGKCVTNAFDHLFVACARALGMAARLAPATGEKEYYAEGCYRALLPAQTPDASLRLVNLAGHDLHYGPDFTVGVLENGAYRTLTLTDMVLQDALTLPVQHGEYRIMTCTRQIDGAIDGLLTCVHIMPGEQAAAEVRMAPERMADKLVRASLPSLHVHMLTGETTSLPVGAQIVALITPGQEPTEHFLNELLEAKTAISSLGVAVQLVLSAPEQASNAKLHAVCEAIPSTRVTWGADPADELAWRRSMHAGDLRLPFATAVDAQGRGLFSFVNYSVGSVQSLLRILQA